MRSDCPFSWRLLDFFSNHFSVSVTNPPMRALAPLLEREAIAPHLFGRSETMLVAVTQHQADVRELALAITGWSVAGPKKDKKAGFMYRPAGHQAR